MSTTINTFDSLLNSLLKRRHIFVPALLMGLVAVLVVPLPPGILDVLLAANISLAAVILLTTVYTKSPLDFSVFPALLLITTLGRLVLNVASTRLILSADAPTPEQAGAIAGHVIEAFGTFVAGSSIIVGGIIFLILVVVQFVVVTKGATRMSEVAARFTLDAMPGRQMAIDADLSAGLIDEHQATRRRDGVMREADFYGAMDGASKFVRGDAIAGLVIILINIIGGLAVGVAVKGWSIVETAELFTRLTIGDGLASQIPSFLIAIAAGLIVARAGNRTPLGLEIPKQLVSQPAALGIVAGFLAALSLTPLPTIPMLALASVLGILAWSQRKEEENGDEVYEMPEVQKAKEIDNDLPIQDSILSLQLGRALLTLASRSDGDNLVQKIATMRATVSQGMGLTIPSIQISDNLELEPNSYRIVLRGGVIGEGVVYADRLMVIAGQDIQQNIEGIQEREPTFGMSAIWVTESVLDSLGELFVQAMGPVSVVMTHMTQVVHAHAPELLSREDVASMVEALRAQAPHLIEEEMSNRMSISRLHHVLKELLEERVPIKDLSTIIETASDCVDLPLIDCVEQVRCSIKRQICATVARSGGQGRQIIPCVVLDSHLEKIVQNEQAQNEAMAAAVHHAALPLVADSLPVVVIASGQARRKLRNQISGETDSVVVLSHEEIVPEVDLHIVGTVKSPV